MASSKKGSSSISSFFKGLKSNICNIFVAALTAALPAYLFISNVFGCPSETYPIIAAISVISFILLFLSYRLVIADTVKTLAQDARKNNKKINPAQAENEVRPKAIAYAFFTTNFVYLAVAVMIGMYVVPRIPYAIPNFINYAASSVVAGVIAYMNAKGYFEI